MIWLISAWMKYIYVEHWINASLSINISIDCTNQINILHCIRTFIYVYMCICVLQLYRKRLLRYGWIINTDHRYKRIHLNLFLVWGETKTQNQLLPEQKFIRLAPSHYNRVGLKYATGEFFFNLIQKIFSCIFVIFKQLESSSKTSKSPVWFKWIFYTKIAWSEFCWMNGNKVSAKALRHSNIKLKLR